MLISHNLFEPPSLLSQVNVWPQRLSYIQPAVLQRCPLSYMPGPQGHIPLGVEGGRPPSGSPHTDPQSQGFQDHSSSGTPLQSTMRENDN